jgi:hypothetical protein
MRCLLVVLAAPVAAVSTWRLRATNGNDRDAVWGLAEVRFFEHTNCTNTLRISSVTASGTAGSSQQLRQIFRPQKAFDRSSFSYWKGVPDGCGELWIAVELEVEAPGCIEVYQSSGLDAPGVALEVFADLPPTPNWRVVTTHSPLLGCPTTIGDCCPIFDDAVNKPSGCDIGVSLFPVPAFSTAADYDPWNTCEYPAYPPPSPPPPKIPPRPGRPPAAPPGEVYVAATIPAGLAEGEGFYMEIETAQGTRQVFVTVPVGAAPGDSVQVLATVVTPPSSPSPPSEPPAAGVNGQIADTDADISGGDVDAGVLTGLGIGLGLLAACVIAMFLYILYMKRKQRKMKRELQEYATNAEIVSNTDPYM